MQISVALDSSRRRDLTFFPGDQVQFDITVYAKDGDLLPITPTSVYIRASDAQFETGSAFPADFGNRSGYVATGLVNGAVTTLAYGLLLTPMSCSGMTCWLDYGVWCCGVRPGYSPQPYFAEDYVLNQYTGNYNQYYL